MLLLEGFMPGAFVKIAQLCNAASTVLYPCGESHEAPDCLINCRYPAKGVVGFDVQRHDT